ncbi:MAG: SAM-dependent methyltransferase [Verrucomicrobiae bacterium]|nr:SAM-dependent methyltransferase [Verrucomicrobiae bacterium]
MSPDETRGAMGIAGSGAEVGPCDAEGRQIEGGGGPARAASRVRGTYDWRREMVPFTSPRENARELVRILRGCETVLDVGCGAKSPLRFFRGGKTLGMDAFRPDLERAMADRTHDEFLFGRAERVAEAVGGRRFDACVALDLIEHLPKEDARRFLGDMEALATRRVVVFVPNGFMPQESREAGDLQAHRSGWTAAEMRALGYEVIGLNGLKVLRGQGHKLRFRPWSLWAIISWLTQVAWCRRHPDTAAALFCWKDV